MCLNFAQSAVIELPSGTADTSSAVAPSLLEKNHKTLFLQVSKTTKCPCYNDSSTVSEPNLLALRRACGPFDKVQAAESRERKHRMLTVEDERQRPRESRIVRKGKQRGKAFERNPDLIKYYFDCRHEYPDVSSKYSSPVKHTVSVLVTNRHFRVLDISPFFERDDCHNSFPFTH